MHPLTQTNDFPLLLATLGDQGRLSDLGIDDKHFRDMAENACKQLGGTLHGFIDLTPDDIVKIYEMCL